MHLHFADFHKHLHIAIISLHRTGEGGGGQMGQTDHCISFVNTVYYTTTAFSLHALTCVQQVLVRELEQCVATVTT